MPTLPGSAFALSDETACAIVKHANPCGVAIGAHCGRRLRKGAEDRSDVGVWWSHRIQSRGRCGGSAIGIAPVCRSGDRSGVQLARRARRSAPNRTCVCLTVPLGDAHNDFDFKRVGGGLLVQTSDDHSLQASELKIVTVLKPTAQQVDDLMFAWKVAKFVKSNAIVFARDGATLGIGAGPDVARRFGAHRVDQGRIGGAEPRGLCCRVRCILPISRWARRVDRCRCCMRHSARRKHARRRSDRCSQRARNRDGVYRRSAFSTLERWCATLPRSEIFSFSSTSESAAGASVWRSGAAFGVVARGAEQTPGVRQNSAVFWPCFAAAAASTAGLARSARRLRQRCYAKRLRAASNGTILSCPLP